MKHLRDLHPTWIGHGGEGVAGPDGRPVPRREGTGIVFDCPCGCASPVYVPFENPLDGKGPIQGERNGWRRTGDTFDTLSIAPSIQRVGGCEWHGWVRSGRVER